MAEVVKKSHEDAMLGSQGQGGSIHWVLRVLGKVTGLYKNVFGGLYKQLSMFFFMCMEEEGRSFLGVKNQIQGPEDEMRAEKMEVGNVNHRLENIAGK